MPMKLQKLVTRRTTIDFCSCNEHTSTLFLDVSTLLLNVWPRVKCFARNAPCVTQQLTRIREFQELCIAIRQKAVGECIYLSLKFFAL